MLISRRAELHRNAADILLARRDAGKIIEPEILALHQERGGRFDEAIECYREAGEQAKARSAMREARHHYQSALSLVAKHPALAGGASEMSLLLGIGPVQQALQGLGSPIVEETYRRAYGIAETLADPRPLFTVTWGLWLLFNQRGRIDVSLPLAHELRAQAEQIGDPALMLQAYHALWPAAFFHGDAQAVDSHVAHALSLYDPDLPRSHQTQFGNHDPLPCAYTFRALARWLQGRDKDAQADYEKVCSTTQTIAHPFTSALAHALGNWIYVFRRCPDKLLPAAEQLIELTETQGFAQWHAYGEIQKGWALAMLGQPDAGLALLDHGLMTNTQLGGHAADPFHLGMRADICLAGGDLDDALVSVERALAAATSNDEHWWEPALLHLKGVILDQLGSPDANEWFARGESMAIRNGTSAMLSVRQINA
jgi:predicted ATPase